eukprot:3059728-Prymnesium_polylepis.1
MWCRVGAASSATRCAERGTAKASRPLTAAQTPPRGAMPRLPTADAPPACRCGPQVRDCPACR